MRASHATARPRLVQSLHSIAEDIRQGQRKTAGKTKRAVLVYQGAVANVFDVWTFSPWWSTSDRRTKVMQGTFPECEAFAHKLARTGYKVASMFCDELGDVTRSYWNPNLADAPLFAQMKPVFHYVRRTPTL